MKPLRHAALALGLFMTCAPASGQETAPETFKPEGDEITTLTGKALKLEAGSSRSDVIASLGPADWVVLPTENSPWGLYPKAVLLMLYWKNSSCTAIAAAFGPDDKLRHMDAGQMACVRSGDFPILPDASLTCAQEYRAQLCK